MSFYSALILAANEGVRVPTPEAVRALFEELGLLDPGARFPGIGDLTPAVTALFEDPAAAAENRHFFCPDSISFATQIHIEGPDMDYTGPGCAVLIHGNGYFFPWELTDIRDRVINTPLLRNLRRAVGGRFGGRFVYPPGREADLRERRIDGEDGWVWFGSESM
jgi:hypothetical protein